MKKKINPILVIILMIVGIYLIKNYQSIFNPNHYIGVKDNNAFELFWHGYGVVGGQAADCGTRLYCGSTRQLPGCDGSCPGGVQASGTASYALYPNNSIKIYSTSATGCKMPYRYPDNVPNATIFFAVDTEDVEKIVIEGIGYLRRRQGSGSPCWIGDSELTLLLTDQFDNVINLYAANINNVQISRIESGSEYFDLPSSFVLTYDNSGNMVTVNGGPAIDISSLGDHRKFVLKAFTSNRQAYDSGYGVAYVIDKLDIDRKGDVPQIPTENLWILINNLWTDFWNYIQNLLK